MLRLKGNNLVLESLTPETAELVRVWRNSEPIRSQMEYQSIISETDQAKWLNSVTNDENRYFLIRYNETPIGMIHLADIDRVQATAETGLFIGEVSYSGTGIALEASVVLLHFAFEELGLKKVYAKIKKGNQQAEDYNEFLGFMREGEYNSGFGKWKLTAENFRIKEPQLMKLLLLI